MTFSDGTTLNIRFEESKRVAKLQRKLSRKNPKSKNSERIREKIRREYLKTANKRDNAANQLCSGLDACEFVITQDDNLNAWKKRRRINKKKHSGKKAFGGKKIQTGILGRVKRRLNHMDNAYLLPRHVKTAQHCHNCGTDTPHKLRQRTFVCPVCGNTSSRDTHAAQNMLLLGKGLIPAERGIMLAELVASGYQTDFSALIPKRLAVKQETLEYLFRG
jgi:transposase